MATEEIVSHWHHSAEEFNTSTIDFYATVETELKATKAPVTAQRIEASEGGLFSAKRTYLRIEYQGLSFVVCAAPFGNNYFFSWWMIQRVPGTGCLGVFAWPILGPILQRLTKPITYYAIDSRLIFEESVHSIILMIVDALLTAKGAKALAPEERKVQSKSVLQ
jgi:hypothetical protein